LSDQKLELQGFLAPLLQEVIWAELNMHRLQVKRWQQFLETAHTRYGVNAHVNAGVAEQRYLGLDQIELAFYLRPLPKQGFWKRVRSAWQVVRRGDMAETVFAPFELCKAGEDDAFQVVLHLKRVEPGTWVAEQTEPDFKRYRFAPASP